MKVTDLTSDQIGKTRDTFDSYYDVYRDKVEWDTGVTELVNRRLVIPFSRGYLKRGSKIALVGCGTGRDMSTFKQMGHDVYGYDISQNMLNEAKKKVPTGKFKKFDLSTDLLPTNYFDGVYCESALSYIPRKKISFALDSIYKSLKPDGKAMLGIKVNGGGKVKEDSILGDTRYYLAYKVEEVEDLVRSGGFRIVNSNIYRDSFNRDTGWYDLFVERIG